MGTETGGCHLCTFILPCNSWKVPSFCSFCFLCFFPTGTIFTFPLCLAMAEKHHLHTLPLPYSRVPVSPGMELLHIPDILIFAATADGMPPFCLTQRPRELCSWVLWDCNNQRDSSRQATTPRTLHCTDSRLKHTPSLSVKEAYSLV